MMSDKDFFKGCSMTIVEDGIIQVSRKKWFKFLINSKRRRYIAEIVLYEDHPYEIAELLKSMGIISEGKIELYDKVTYKGIDYVVKYGNSMDEETPKYAFEQAIEKIDFTYNQVIQIAAQENIEVVDIEEVYRNSTDNLESDSGIILYHNGLCLDLSDYEKLSRRQWLADSTIDYFVQYFFIKHVPIEKRDTFVIIKTSILREIELMADLENKNLPIAQSLKNALDRPLRGKKFLDIETFVMPVISQGHFKLIIIMHEINSVRYDIKYLDSLYSEPLENVVESVKYFIKYHYSKSNTDKEILFNFEFPSVPKQAPFSGDCGIYVIKFAETLFKHKMILKIFSPKDALLMRQELAVIIRESIEDPKIIAKLPILKF